MKAAIQDLYDLIPHKAHDLRLQAFLLESNSVEELDEIARTAQDDSYQAIPASARLKAAWIRNNINKGVSWTTDPDSTPKCDISAFTYESEWRGKEVGRYNQRNVIVEWKPVSLDLPFDKMEARICEIAGLLRETNKTKPKDLIILDCLGAMVRPGVQPTVGLVYSMPMCTADSGPTTLFEILGRKNASGGHGPALEYRRKLACSLARAVFQLHVVGWLHKSIRPQNIAFFGSTNVLESPYLIGFDYARRRDIAETSERPDSQFNTYRHPDAQGNARKRYVSL